MVMVSPTSYPGSPPHAGTRRDMDRRLCPVVRITPSTRGVDFPNGAILDAVHGSPPHAGIRHHICPQYRLHLRITPGTQRLDKTEDGCECYVLESPPARGD
jgi:hypothetical protein